MKFIRVFLLVIVLAAVAVLGNLWTIPEGNVEADHFDVIIVLGSPANLDGSPSPAERARVIEAIREYRSGVASEIIMTGGPAHNRFVEGHVMAELAVSEGVPASAIIEERQAQNTIQNIFYSAEILRDHHWHTAEVISSRAHLPRAALILQAFDTAHPEMAVHWKTHAAPWPPELSLVRRALLDSLEWTRCLQIRLFGFPRSRFLP